MNDETSDVRADDDTATETAEAQDDSQPVDASTDAAADAEDFADVTEEELAADPTRFARLSSKALEVSQKISNVGVDGLGPWKGSVTIAEEHLKQHGNVEDAIKRLIATHVRLASSTGFLAGVGGLITVPVTLPADFTSLWVMQARLAGAIAHLRGYDVRTDEVRSVVLISLIGSSVSEVFSQAGIQFSQKSAVAAIKHIPGTVLTKINQRVGFRLLTKAGSKGVVNLTKLAPVVGGVVGGGVNFASTRAVGSWAKMNFPAIDPNHTTPAE
jgi:hypothetical protein